MSIFQNFLPATKRDLLDSESRILAAVELSGQDRAKLDAVLKRAERTARNSERLARSLKKLDAET